MSGFQKRSVPGLEDCSDSENEDNEIELAISHNEFSSDLIVNGDLPKSETLVNNVQQIKNKRVNNIWSNVVQDEILDGDLNKLNFHQNKVKRQVESYSLPPNKRNFDRKQRPERSRSRLRSRIESRSYQKNKDRSHIKLQKDLCLNDIVDEIARVLSEPHKDIIERCYLTLGYKRCLEFLYITEDLEENGGLMVYDGSRRRTPGGVFLQLIKECPDIREEDKKTIFINDLHNRKQKPDRFRKSRSKHSGNSSPKSVKMDDVTNNHVVTQPLNSDDIEEGEIV